MCGIMGAVAKRPVADILLQGLIRLEYRGYDSAGIAILHPQTSKIQRIRAKGKVSVLAEKLKKKHLQGHIGISHTRWATHGKPTENNAHPHCSENSIAIVHNGIIENHEALRQKLLKLGYQFKTETDTEVIVHLIRHYSKKKKELLFAVKHSVQKLVGSYALGIISVNEPRILYATRRGSPLIIGLGISEQFIASDLAALLSVAQRFIYLEEGDIAKIGTNSVTIYNDSGKSVKRTAHNIKINYEIMKKGKFRHYMKKEIFEQPQGALNTVAWHLINNRINPKSMGDKAESIFKNIKRLQLVACGTSYHAALVGRYWLESLADIPCQVEIASEHRYRKGVVESNTLFIALSQSGETADTLAALRQAKKLGYAATLGICNVPTSSIVREADLVFLTQAGIEIGVAATKTFTTQLVSLLLLAALLRRKENDYGNIIKHLQSLPSLLQKTLALNTSIKRLSRRFINKEHALLLGRGALFPIALEGALKLKEISYMHAEAYPAGELKHGPLALVDKGMPVIVIAPNDHLIEKLKSNIQEVQVRGGELFIFLDEKVRWQLKNHYSSAIRMPTMSNVIAPIVYTIPLQLLAYHIAILKKIDVDQPRNLAKSVTVE
ncbi:glutamine--fructose-6-phosphate transaminase (isomerizing) [Coxiella endosymbiont of Amblyomma nuttalli]|uniref:glutamine--fructose-6-phosphate transaminase (isomerizing) n=1 Tax=Coxiella endosymbiont of Amblyomma nuttalli TaxID=2749996 RepID=UPI001BA571C0|nr:glutamine--fructose-6-phosphate transaminase (isomerizing) [Coxiella endosymbiont of Amblyomma nuttalli]QTS84202.1 Glutamine--fructose-6-phosphate aminotransferase [isomerizing] [Coxiella endosymbiont of Amblyomma nuttalli]